MPFERPLSYSYMYRATPAPPPPPPEAPSAAPSAADELKKLAALHDAGHLSDDEFAAAKASLLAGS
jgi:hypothetical protein